MTVKATLQKTAEAIQANRPTTVSFRYRDRDNVYLLFRIETFQQTQDERLLEAVYADGNGRRVTFRYTRAGAPAAVQIETRGTRRIRLLRSAPSRPGGSQGGSDERSGVMADTFGISRHTLWQQQQQH